MLYFNRVAKTGSQSFTHLLLNQGKKLGFSVWPKLKQSESLVDTKEGLADEIDSVVKMNKPTVFVRHYSFIDFEKELQTSWRPDWFNIVRDPIDKVSIDTRSLSYKQRFISNDFEISQFLKKIKQQTSLSLKN